MEKLKTYITEHQVLISIIVIITYIAICFVLFSHNYYGVLSDKGRELLLPSEMLKGKVPYRDITLIYFPMAYYVNMLIFKFFGSSIDTLIVASTLISTGFSIVFYLMSKEFLSNKISLILTLLVISSCIFDTGIHNFILTYSYARIYGIMSSATCLYFLIKLLKTNTKLYAYLASLFAGFAMSCKLEFVSILLILGIGLFIHRKLNKIDYLKVLALTSIFPVIIISTLFLSGVTVQNIADAISYAIIFSKTPTMTNFLSVGGMYPSNFMYKLGRMLYYTACLSIVAHVCFYMHLIMNRYKKMFIIAIIIAGAILYQFIGGITYTYWIALPISVLCFFIIKFKDVKTDKPLLLLTIGALILSQREFFFLLLYYYGVYSFPLLILTMSVYLTKYVKPVICNINTQKLLCSIFVALTCMYFATNIQQKRNLNVPIVTPKGTIYTSAENASLVEQTINYVSKLRKNTSVLVLPEGCLINYVTDSPVDMHCFMMDRLYYEAYGENKAAKMVANSNSDYIIVAVGLDIFDFFREYLYSEKNKLTEYINNNYSIVETFAYSNSKITIYKRN